MDDEVVLHPFQKYCSHIGMIGMIKKDSVQLSPCRFKRNASM